MYGDGWRGVERGLIGREPQNLWLWLRKAPMVFRSLGKRQRERRCGRERENGKKGKRGVGIEVNKKIIGA